MGDLNQYILIERIIDELDGPFLEVGSKDYGSTQDLRSLLAARGDYVGLDMASGPGVDIVFDLTADFDEVDRALGGKRFGTIICLSVLEHCDQPFAMARNLSRLLRPGGKVIVCVPFSWKFHGYPSDYWRFTHEGIKKLFGDLTFDMDRGYAATSRVGEFKPLNEELGRAQLTPSAHSKQGHNLRALTAKILRLLGHTWLLSWITGYRYVLVPTNVFMVGTLPGKPQSHAA